MKIIWLLLLSANVFGYAEKSRNLEEFGDKAKYIHIDPGSVLMVEQLTKEKSLKSPVYLTFRCDKASATTKCELERIDASKSDSN